MLTDQWKENCWFCNFHLFSSHLAWGLLRVVWVRWMLGPQKTEDRGLESDISYLNLVISTRKVMELWFCKSCFFLNTVWKNLPNKYCSVVLRFHDARCRRCGWMHSISCLIRRPQLAKRLPVELSISWFYSLSPAHSGVCGAFWFTSVWIPPLGTGRKR